MLYAKKKLCPGVKVYHALIMVSRGMLHLFNLGDFVYINLYPVGVMMLLIMSWRNINDGPRGMIANKLCPWAKTSSLLIHRGCTCSC